MATTVRSADPPAAKGVTAPRLGGLHALLFAAYPVLFLWSENIDEIAPDQAVEPLLIAVGAAALATLVLGLILGDLRRSALVVTPVVFGALMYGHVAALSHLRPEVLALAWAALVVLGMIGAARLGPKALATVDGLLLVLGSVLVAVPLITIVPRTVEDAMAPRPILASDTTLPKTTTAPKRDVYWLVFDRYGSDRSFELQFGVKNDLTPWLRDRGFTVLDDSHANYVSTALSLSTTMNMTHLDSLIGNASRGSSSYAPVHSAMQASRVVRQFRALGYHYEHLGSWWNPTRTDAAADVNHNADTASEFSTVLVEMSVLPVAIEALGIEQEPPSESTKHRTHNTYALDTLDRLARQPGPKFVFGHVLLPHPPYVFDRDGRYMAPDEQATLATADRWHRQLDYTNQRLKAFLERLFALPPDQRPIVILQADEGPWIDDFAAARDTYDWGSASPDELEIKFGILNAWYLPGGEDLDLDPAMTAINTFPVLFARYYGLEGYALLPDRVASSPTQLPYRLTDVTERLPSLR